MGVYRVVWVPGSDRLLGVCHCGAEHASDDPTRVWRWLFAHPDHDGADHDGAGHGDAGHDREGGRHAAR